MSVTRLLRNGLRYWRAYGTRHLLNEVQRRLTTPLPPGMAPANVVLAPPPPPPPAGKDEAVSARALLQGRLAASSPLPVFVVPADERPRITVVTDSLSRQVFFGGVATSMIVALLLARSRGARLRIVTRVEPPQGGSLQALFELHGLAPPEGEIEFAFAHVNASQAQLNVYAGELFLTTSWWTTAATLATVPAARVLYLVQEDERDFYPAGEERLRCHQVLANEGLRVVVNTAGLLRQLTAEGLSSLPRRAVAFEPVFPAALFHPRPRPPGAKRRLMFYARPSHPRNLFYFGLELIEQALTRGLIDGTAWEIHFAGIDVPAIRFADGSQPVVHERLAWRDWAELVGTMDLGISLMLSAHPSYPPLDLAASGAVVLTNRWGSKQDLAALCRNIVTADATLPAMLAALREAVALAGDDAERARRHAAHRLGGDWPGALAPVLEAFGRAGVATAPATHAWS